MFLIPSCIMFPLKETVWSLVSFISSVLLFPLLHQVYCFGFPYSIWSLVPFILSGLLLLSFLFTFLPPPSSPPPVPHPHAGPHSPFFLLFPSPPFPSPSFHPQSLLLSSSRWSPGDNTLHTIPPLGNLYLSLCKCIKWKIHINPRLGVYCTCKMISPRDFRPSVSIRLPKGFASFFLNEKLDF